VQLRAKHEGMPVLFRQVRISELPPRQQLEREPRTLRWWERTLGVGMPRGPRRTDWGLRLLSPTGRLLDERPLATRVETISFAIHVNGSKEPSSTSVVGDRRDPPTVRERDEAADMALAVEDDARNAAARRRISSEGELESYLRWRLSARAGELLVLDPHLLRGKDSWEADLEFLLRLDRPVRALTASLAAGAKSRLPTTPWLEVQLLPQGGKSLHDRVWIVGETALLVGASISSFLPKADGSATAFTTAIELTVADAAAWRERFEAWWR
jgi:hypothetical protein